MIKQVTEFDILRVLYFCKGSPFGAYIASSCLQYGFDKSFAKQWLCENDGEIYAAFCMKDGSFTLLANYDAPFDEISSFLNFMGFSSLLTDEKIALKLGYKDYFAKSVMKFSRCDDELRACKASAEMKEVFKLLCEEHPEAFENTSDCYLSFLSDFTYHSNRNAARIKACFDSEELAAIALTSAETETDAVLSGICTRKDKRKKGFAKACVVSLSNELCDENKNVFVVSRNDSATEFYKKIGFNYYSTAAYIERK